MENCVPFESLIGLTLTKITTDEPYIYYSEECEAIRFYTENETFVLTHFQDCCELVRIEDIYGDLNDLIGSPILMAELTTSNPEVQGYGDSETWSFYKLATVKGYVTIRWYGTSNGYYSETVNFFKL